MMKHARDGGIAVSCLKTTSGEAVPLTGVEVDGEIVGAHARVVVRQRYTNREARSVEAVYTFPLPSRAVVSGFSMTAGERRLEGEVHEREEAFARYDDAISAGHGAALLEQERPNVFTANVGNLLPGEEMVIAIEYVEPVRVDEGSLRFTVPTLVAPRYVPRRTGPGAPDRTGHGTASPTDRVPDADRISPPIAAGALPYGLSLSLVFDVGAALDVESPSHAIVVNAEGAKTRVTLSRPDVALDRDVVIVATSREEASAIAPIAGVVAHRLGETEGTFAVTVVPDLMATAKKPGRADVVFLLDRSGSMGGASIVEARTALRLCLRQLREGDRFAILAFDDVVEVFDPDMVPFTQATLSRADVWIESIDARGGTELLGPLTDAVGFAPDGIVVLLTDGQVANEDEILRAVLARRSSTRVYSFGIGTNVSDALLEGLADETGGAVETIHPGERIDEKVIAQFARATSPRVTELRVSFRGVDVGETAPAEPQALVDGEPFTIFGRYEMAGLGAVELRGKLGGEAFYLEVPVDLPESSDRPTVPKLWAQARIRDLERANVTGRREGAMRDRIVRLAKEHGVSSKHTSFVVVEKRTGDRRMNAQPETRVVPVAPPAGWTGAPRMMSASRSRGLGGAAPRVMPAPRMVPSMRACSVPRAPGCAPPVPPRFDAAPPIPMTVSSRAPRAPGASDDMARSIPLPTRASSLRAPRTDALGFLLDAPEPAATPAVGDPVLRILSAQAASGLWEESGRDPIEATTTALVALLRLGVTASDAVGGAQVKKAIEALIERISASAPSDPRLAELALGVAWLLATGKRTRRAVEATASGQHGLGGLVAMFGNESAVRERVEGLAAP